MVEAAHTFASLLQEGAVKENAQYKALAEGERKVIFGGRLGEYKYYDMDATIASALECVRKELEK